MEEIYRRIPFFILAGIASLLILFAFYQLIKSFKVISTRYGRTNMIAFYYFLFFSLGWCILHYVTAIHDYPLGIYVYYMKLYYRDLFSLTYLVIFLGYLIYALHNRFNSSRAKFYYIFRIVLYVTLILYWIILLPLASITLFKRYKNSEHKFTVNVLYIPSLVYGILLSLSLIILFVCYCIELKNYAETFNRTKAIIIFAIIASFLQACSKIADSVLVINDVYRELGYANNRMNFPIREVVIFIIDLFSDLTTSLALIFYFKKDTENLMVVTFAVDEFTDTESECTASLIEEKLIEFMLRRKSKSDPISTNISGSLITQ